MSEKKLRKGVQDYMAAISPSASQVAWDELEEALADPPDVVKVLRWAKKAHDTYRDEYGDTKPDDVAYLNGMKSIPWFVEKECHIRLTEAGWEWTDE